VAFYNKRGTCEQWIKDYVAFQMAQVAIPDRCSRRFCGSSRSYGRSHRPRQHEAFDCHTFKRDRQEECAMMPVKIAKSAPRASFGLPELLVTSTPRVSLATRPERREYSRQFGSHPGNPG
jgi:hypothetical protein